jgi:hypothetical protein
VKEEDKDLLSLPVTHRPIPSKFGDTVRVVDLLCGRKSMNCMQRPVPVGLGGVNCSLFVGVRLVAKELSPSRWTAMSPRGGRPTSEDEWRETQGGVDINCHGGGTAGGETQHDGISSLLQRF